MNNFSSRIIFSCEDYFLKIKKGLIEKKVITIDKESSVNMVPDVYLNNKSIRSLKNIDKTSLQFVCVYMCELTSNQKQE